MYTNTRTSKRKLKLLTAGRQRERGTSAAAHHPHSPLNPYLHYIKHNPTQQGGDVSVAALVRLLIIDEVHLLNDERGAVIESLVARTKRQVEASQRMIRIVGLSATLPNYRDVGSFLGANPETGLFYFDQSYR